MQSRMRKKTLEDHQPTRYYSKRQETDVANTISGRLTKNSGATPWQKGDILTDQFLIECKTKTCKSQSIVIKKEWLDKINHEALFMGKEHCALVFNFEPDGKNYIILDFDEFKSLL